MAWIRRAFFRFFSVFTGRRQDQELDEELRFCLEMETEEKIRQGMNPDEARRAACLKIGGLEQVKETCRDHRGFPLLESLLQDIRHGIRQLRRNPGLSIVVILLVALGVGATTAIFSVASAVLLEPLPYESPEQLTMLWEADARVSRVPVAGLNFLDWKEQNRSFERIVAYRPCDLNLSGSGDPERVLGALVTPGLFELLRVPPMMGRTFEDKDELAGNTNVAIISNSLWRRRLGGDPGVLGKSILLDGEAFVLIGIMPPHFSHPCPWSIGEKTEVWRPYPRTELTARSRDSQWLLVMGRLRDDVSLETAQQEMNAIARRLEEHYPDTNADKWVNVVPMLEDLVGRVAGHIMILQGAAGIILLIVSINAAGLLMARATTRQTDMVIRFSLGAGRPRLIRQMLMENMPLSLLGGGLGILLANWGLGILRATIPVDIPRFDEIQIDGWVLTFALGVSLLTGFIFSLIPLLVTSGSEFKESLKQGRGTSRTGPRLLRIRHLLVISQFALALILANGALLMLQSYQQLTQMDHGFSIDDVLTVRLTLQGPRYESEGQIRAFYAELLDPIGALPGVRHVAAVSRLPLEGGTNAWAEIEGREAGEEKRHVEIKTATGGYFRAMGIAMLRGRDFVARDSSPAQPGVIINQCMAELCWPAEDPLGKRFRFGDTEWLTVVGVVANTRQWGAEIQPISEAYFPYINPPVSGLSAFTRVKYLIVRTAIDPPNLVAPVRREVARLDRDQPISEVRTMEQVLAESLARRGFNTLLIGIFAALALILVAAGIYGSMSFSVAQRTHEIGVRMALGADRSRVLMDVLGRGLRQALIGTAIGLVGVLAARQLLASMLYGVSPTNPLTFAAVAGLLVVVALAACYIPGRTATRVNPVEALRYE